MHFFFGEAASGPKAAGLFLLRAVTGAAFMFHGWPKFQHAFVWMGADSPVPAIFQFLAAFSEFAGGFALIIGLLTQLAAFGIACTMVVALGMVHLPKGDPFVGKGGSYELAAVYLAIMAVIILFGPGVLSLDALLFRWKQKRHSA